MAHPGVLSKTSINVRRPSQRPGSIVPSRNDRSTRTRCHTSRPQSIPSVVRDEILVRQARELVHGRRRGR